MPRPDDLASRLRDAAAAEDLAALHALVDWELTGAAPLARALTAVDAADRAAVARRGFEELDRGARDPDAVRSKLGDLLRALVGGDVRPGSAEIAAAVRVPDPPEGLDPEQERRLGELRERAASVQEALVVERPHAAGLPLAVAPDGERVVIVSR